MGLRSGSVRLALCALLIGTASAWALAPHDKAVGPGVMRAPMLSSDNAVKQPQASAEHGGAANGPDGKTGKSTAPDSVEVRAKNDEPASSQNGSPGDGKGLIDEATLAIAFLTLCALVVQTVIFGLQARRLKETIDTMDRVAKDQGESSKQAIENSVAQINLTRETSLVSDRPYYHLFTVASQAAFAHGTFDSWRFQVIWKNFGKISPKNLIGISSYDFRDDVIGDDFDFPDKILENGPPRKHQIFVGPDVMIPGAAITLPVRDAQAIHEGRKHLYIWGWSEYDDGFKDTPRRRSEFAFKVEFVGLPTDPNPAGVALVRCEKHNGADEECMKPATT